ncbi:MAG: Maf-like protein YhdE [Alphaproteobacteria bacterium MarineAlpha9_Bin4]|nr:septum formation protein Maf [Pelagibacterales bacterium]PPR24904.1 MAG: Maf-like protein YhdE [Alphaproteobacteria bacterium MarineAlpha9_Bin4]
MSKKKIELILSSSSKNRELILKKIRVPFKVFTPKIIEVAYDKEKPQHLSKRLSLEKALQAKKLFKNSFILAADTVVYSRTKIIDKTQNVNQAKLNLMSLSGRRHRVFTGVTFFSNEEKYFQYVSKSVVKFKTLQEKEIDKYLSFNEWKGCAGSYSIQGFAESFVEMISGSFSNVVGLPMHIIYKLFKNNKLI